ncbi:MAG: winged helix-turn-helix transcriptional regulator [Chloroflexi bacterium]|nr:winged helix-turn-helix transcriptional regulator [Chloroflexota bacterium]
MTKKILAARSARRSAGDFLDSTTLNTLAALADRTRVQMLLLLGEKGRLCVGDIAANFRISRPAISHHLKVLKAVGVLQSEKVGQEVYYWVDCRNLVTMLRGLADTLEASCPLPQGEDE